MRRGILIHVLTQLHKFQNWPLYKLWPWISRIAQGCHRDIRHARMWKNTYSTTNISKNIAFIPYFAVFTMFNLDYMVLHIDSSSFVFFVGVWVWVGVLCFCFALFFMHTIPEIDLNVTMITGNISISHNGQNARNRHHTVRCLIRDKIRINTTEFWCQTKQTLLLGMTKNNSAKYKVLIKTVTLYTSVGIICLL